MLEKVVLRVPPGVRLPDWCCIVAYLEYACPVVRVPPAVARGTQTNLKHCFYELNNMVMTSKVIVTLVVILFNKPLK